MIAFTKSGSSSAAILPLKVPRFATFFGLVSISKKFAQIFGLPVFSLKFSREKGGLGSSEAVH